MDKKQLAVIIASLGAVLAIVSKVVSGEAQLDGPIIAALWGAAAPAIGIVTAKAAVDQHVDEKHAATPTSANG